jgi:hypothetical protein
MKSDDVFTLHFHKAFGGSSFTDFYFHYYIPFQQMLKAIIAVKIEPGNTAFQFAI